MRIENYLLVFLGKVKQTVNIPIAIDTNINMINVHIRMVTGYVSQMEYCLVQVIRLVIMIKTKERNIQIYPRLATHD